MIPSKVLQASLFQKPYYTKVFLRTLLSPSLPNSVDPSRLIQALARYLFIVTYLCICVKKKLITFRQNKIPQKMLDTYARPRQGNLGKKNYHTNINFVDLIPDVCSPAALAKTEVDRIDALFQRLLEVMSKGEFPEKGQRLLSKISTTLSSFADSDVSVPGRELNWDTPNVSQNLLQVSTASTLLAHGMQIYM